MNTASMATLNLHEDAASIVIIGHFNPAIFHPSWLLAKGLIRPSEADEAKLEITHSEVSRFTVGTITITVTQNRLVVFTSDPTCHEPIRDLVIGVCNLLDQTPASAMGLNRHMHFGLQTAREWNAVGDALVPKSPWQKLMRNAGMRKVVVEGARNDDLPAKLLVTVEPSAKVSHGVFVEVNNEFTVKDKALDGSVSYLMDIVHQHWAKVLEDAKELATALVSESLGDR